MTVEITLCEYFSLHTMWRWCSTTVYDRRKNSGLSAEVVFQQTASAFQDILALVRRYNSAGHFCACKMQDYKQVLLFLSLNQKRFCLPRMHLLTEQMAIDYITKVLAWPFSCCLKSILLKVDASSGRIGPLQTGA